MRKAAEIKWFSYSVDHSPVVREHSRLDLNEESTFLLSTSGYDNTKSLGLYYVLIRIVLYYVLIQVCIILGIIDTPPPHPAHTYNYTIHVYVHE